MSKKKNDKIYYIDKAVVDIDYEKLEKAIIKANKEIEGAKIEREYTTTAGIMGIFSGSLLRIFGVIGLIASLCTIVFLFINLNILSWKGVLSVVFNILLIALILLICMVFVVLGFKMIKSAKEIENEKDKNYVVAVFTALVSFAAMIVAFVALVK